jgi:hypothetical protein
MWKDKIFDKFVATLNNLNLASIQIFIHIDKNKYEEYE